MEKLRRILPFLDTFAVLVVIPLTVYIALHQETKEDEREKMKATLQLISEIHRVTKPYTDTILKQWPQLKQHNAKEVLSSLEVATVAKPIAERTEAESNLTVAIRDLMDYYEVQVFPLYNRNLADRKMIRDQFGNEIQTYLKFFSNWRDFVKTNYGATYLEIEKGQMDFVSTGP